MSTLKVDSLIPMNSGSETYFLTRAWVVFDSYPSVVIAQDGNVSTITDNGIGDFTINFSSAITDANYAMNGSTIGANFGSGEDGVVIKPDVQTTYPNPVISSTSVRVQIGGNGVLDKNYNAVSITR